MISKTSKLLWLLLGVLAIGNQSKAAGISAGVRGGNAPDTPFFVDLGAVVNTSLEDDGIANNGAGGWLDNGMNDLFLYPSVNPGKVVRYGYHFTLTDPAQHNGKGVLILQGAGAAADRLQSATVPVPRVKGKYIYVLHHWVDRTADAEPGSEVAHYNMRYSDGASATLPVRLGKELRSWNCSWNDRHGSPTAWPIIKGVNHHSLKYKQYKVIWATQWKNPFPEKAIESIHLSTNGGVTTAIYAITIADKSYSNGPEAQKGVDLPPQPYWVTAPFDYFDEKLEQVNPLVFDELTKMGMVKGVRDVQLIRPDLIGITVDPALTKVAEGVGEKKAAAFQVPETFTVASNDDTLYWNGHHPVEVGRKSFEYWNGDVGPYRMNVVYWHTYYLKLPYPLTSGNHYSIAVNPMEGEFDTTGDLYYDVSRMVTPAIKINQVAYSPQASKRYAYLGWWAADLGRVDYAAFDIFHVIDERTTENVLTGNITIRKASDWLSGEDVYQLDLSALGSGKYRIHVPGLGCSEPFYIGGHRMRELYYHTNRAYFHQRCGQAFTEPYTTFSKPACHLEAYQSGHLVTPHHAPKTRGQIKSFSGGYHDAADFDCFAHHLRATAQTLSVYAYAPEKFKDGDLNIPESGNGIPDLLDEAKWGLSFYLDNQLTDGGIPFGRGNDQDYILDWEHRFDGSRPPFGVFPPTLNSSSEFAAVAAQYARLIQPYDLGQAEKYLDAARKAYQWASTKATVKEADVREKMNLTWAACELYATTGEEIDHEQFKARYAEVFAEMANVNGVAIYLWGYVTSHHAGIDGELKRKIRKRLLQEADDVASATERPAYRVGAGEKGEGLGWGNLNGGGHYADPCIRAYMLNGKQEYLDAACLNADFQLGANPLGKTFVTGMGARPPVHPQISAFLYTRPGKTGETVKGITVYGIADRQLRWFPEAIPVWRRWRDLGNGGAEISSEFTVTQVMGASSMLYSLLYALAG